MDDTLVSRLKRWLTPEHGLPVIEASTLAPIVCTDFRLYVFAVDGLSRGLLDPARRQLHFDRLRDRLLPNLRFRADARDIDEIGQDGAELWLTPMASDRWLAQSGRSTRDVEFGFLYSPFAIARGSRCLSGGWVVPPCSRSPFPYPRLHVRHGVQRLALRLLPPPEGPGRESDDPAAVVRQIRPSA